MGYVIHKTSYASPAWFANKTENKEIERVQRKATIWIMGNWDKSYKQKLTELRLIPLSYYFELQDLLMLVSMLKGSYNIKPPIKLNTKPNGDLSLTRQKDLTSITKTRTRKADESFWKRTSQLLNIIRKKKGNIDLEQIDKPCLTKLC